MLRLSRVRLLLYAFAIMILGGTGLAAHLWSNLGFIALLHDDAVQAEQMFERAVQIDMNMSSAWRGLSESLLNQAKANAALAAVDRSVTQQPDNSFTRVRRAQMRLTTGNTKGALEDLRAIGSAVIVSAIGHRLAVDERGRAIAPAVYRLVIELDPNDAIGYYYLGAALRSASPPRFTEAQAVLLEGSRLASDRSLFHLLLGQNSYSMSHYSEAVQYLDLYIMRRPEDFLGWYWRGLAHASLGDIPKAISDYQAAIALNSTDPNPYLQLGIVLEKQGNSALALEYFQKTLTLLPNNIEALAAVDRLQLK